MNKNTNEILDRDDWELQAVIKHKKDPVNFPLNTSYVKKWCRKMLQDCETGIALGEGWHGGMTREEWKNEKKYIKKILMEL
jgi:hypothetical protein